MNRDIRLGWLIILGWIILENPSLILGGNNFCQILLTSRSNSELLRSPSPGNKSWLKKNRMNNREWVFTRVHRAFTEREWTIDCFHRSDCRGSFGWQGSIYMEFDNTDDLLVHLRVWQPYLWWSSIIWNGKVLYYMILISQYLPFCWHN
jgi:hypothetical protein